MADVAGVESVTVNGRAVAVADDGRFSTAVELFPWRFTELRVMARYEQGPGLGDASVFDLISFLHVYL